MDSVAQIKVIKSCIKLCGARILGTHAFFYFKYIIEKGRGACLFIILHSLRS